MQWKRKFSGNRRIQEEQENVGECMRNRRMQGKLENVEKSSKCSGNENVGKTEKCSRRRKMKGKQKNVVESGECIANRRMHCKKENVVET